MISRIYGLDPDQISQIVEAIREQHGPRLPRSAFVEHVLAVFEDIPGFETLPGSIQQAHLRRLWVEYKTRASG